MSEHRIVEADSDREGTAFDRETHVRFTKARDCASIDNHTARRPTDVVRLRYVKQGSNRLISPPRIEISTMSGNPATVSIEALLYAIKEMQEAS